MDRVERLKEELLNLTHVKYRIERELSLLSDEKVMAEPLVVRKAHALALMLREMPVYILEGELIVGGKSMNCRTMYFWGEMPGPEFDKNYLKDHLVWGTREYQSKYGPQSGRTFAHYATEEENEEAAKAGVAEGSAVNHFSPMWERVLMKGIGGLRDEARRRVASLSIPKDKKKADFLRAVIVAMEGAEAYILRYAELAARMATEEKNEKRRTELEEISRICTWISSNPPRTFREALQLYFHTFNISLTELHSHVALGRIDQYMYPFYKRDLDEGRITKEEAQELLECLWIKFNTTTDLHADNGFQMVVGGQTRDGLDATNDLSYMCLDALARLRLADPKLHVRIYKGMSEKFLRKICEVIKMGIGGLPMVFNDELIIPTWQKFGASLSDARDYCPDGCSEPLVYGKSNNWPNSSHPNLIDCVAKAVEHLEEFDTFEDFFGAVKDDIGPQWLRGSVGGWEGVNKRDEYMVRTGFAATPFTSAITDNCLEKMMDLSAGGAVYNFSGCGCGGLANAADALAAVKKLIYEEKVITKKELLDALHSNYEGMKGERIRQLLINRVPKYGNDDDYVDLLAKELVETYCDEVRRHRNPRGGEWIPGLHNFFFMREGIEVGATPDGRRNKEMLACHTSPVPGRDVKGPIAAIKSFTKLDQTLTPDGAVLDLKLSPSSMEGYVGTEKLMALLKTFMEMKGMTVQFNVVDAKTLRNAQQSPEKYKDLLVRVYGFAAYFVTLAPEYQEHIIARTEHNI